MNIINDKNYLDARINLLSGSITGIWENNDFFIGDSPYPLPPLNYVTANLIDLQRFTKVNEKIIYHLSGYGSNIDEAKLSFLGESAERYSFSLMPISLKNSMIFASYNEMIQDYGIDSILPLKYINIFDENEMETISKNDKIQWVKMNKLLNPEKEIYIPAQLVMFYNKSNEEKIFNKSAVSTGTACHENIEAAVVNALIEYLQIDSFNLWWYGGYKGENIIIDLEKFFDRYFKISYKEFNKYFEIKFTDISFDKGIWVVVCEIFSDKKRPKYIVGVQGSFSKEKAIYRSFMEALTVMAYSMKMSWIDESFYKFDNKKIDNLDKNVAYYAINGKPKLKTKPKVLKTKSKVENLKDLIESNKDLLEWSAIINITPIEFKNINLNVVRIICPNLLPVAIPDYPPTNHPRYKDTGGILNYVAHPMA